jgi:hypothetical protein
MKRLINKLFEWLGYVPKAEVAKLEYLISKYETLINQMRENREYLIRQILSEQSKASYYWNKISENEWRFVVYVDCDRHIPYNVVKSYVSDDFGYAKLCAVELCEKLNERI